ncbi:MAG TPA: hypothetical protein VFT95_14025 [Micromonosporaceae bacterium]|nr:hypothetical protein [Micromonosporaceae bacterium]
MSLYVPPLLASRLWAPSWRPCTPPETCDPHAAIEADRSTSMFNAYFPRRMFEHRRWFGGSFPRDAMDNSYFEFSAGGVDWLVLNLKYRPTDDEMAWANRVVARHPHQQVVIVTHEYQRGAVRTATGERIWNELARRYANVQFVLSGHFSRAGSRVDPGDAGNTVYQIEADYQTYSLPDVNENSYLRLMAFDTRAGTVEVKTFSPYCESTLECPAYKTDANNQFTLTDVRFPTDSDG